MVGLPNIISNLLSKTLKSRQFKISYSLLNSLNILILKVCKPSILIELFVPPKLTIILLLKLVCLQTGNSISCCSLIQAAIFVFT